MGLFAGARHLSAQYAIYSLLSESGSLPGGEVSAWISSWVWVLYVGPYAFLGLLFPDGRLPGRRWRGAAGLGVLVIVAGAVVAALAPRFVYGLGPIRNPLGIDLRGASGVAELVVALLYSLVFVTAISLFVRLRHASGTERQQLKWVASAGAVAVFGAYLKYAVVSEAVSAPPVSFAASLLLMVGLVGIPITMGIAILKYRLYDIDVLVNRALVYGALSACVVGTYMLVVGGLGALFQANDNLAIALVGTGLAAILFAPLRDRLQRAVNHLTYGERDEPYEMLSRLGQRLESTLALNAALRTIVETVAGALKLPYAAISLKQGDAFEVAAAHGVPAEEATVLPLVHQGEVLGRLVLAPRAPGEPFTAADRRLLEDLARQAGATVHGVRLTADLQRSRERLVTALEEERRRLRRDLHDGLGPTLAGLICGLDAARGTLVRGPDATEALLTELKTQAQTAVSDIRHLVYGLRPPALDDLGLVCAIRQQAQDHGQLADGPPVAAGDVRCERGPVFYVEAPEHLPPLSAATEVVCYRIAQEAMTNVVRHASANACRVSLSIDRSRGVLELEVADDGAGVPDDRRMGVGLSSMRERAAELGGSFEIRPAHAGGTRVLACLPLPVEE